MQRTSLLSLSSHCRANCYLTAHSRQDQPEIVDNDMSPHSLHDGAPLKSSMLYHRGYSKHSSVPQKTQRHSGIIGPSASLS